jgi:aldose 1-epimerase
MPAMLGWHPWFMKPHSAALPFRTMLQRGDDYLPTGRSVQAQLENADDCFTDLDGVIALTIGDQHLQVQSDCSHWVVYNQPAHATCVEPQSGPPNEVNDAPFLLPAGETMTRHFTISWL